MKEIDPDIRAASADRGGQSCSMIAWRNVGPEDVCVAQRGPYPSASFQAVGTFDGASVLIEGSNDGEEYAVLKDRWGMQMRIGTNAICTMGDLTRCVRPAIRGGGTETNLTITMVVP